MLLAVGQVQQVERRLLSYLEHAFARLVPCITPHLVSEATLRHARLASRRRRLGRIADALRSHAVRCRARPEHLRGRHVRGMPRIGCQRYAAGAGPHQLEYSQFDAALSAHPICQVFTVAAVMSRAHDTAQQAGLSRAPVTPPH